MNTGAKKAGLNTDGPHSAFIIKGYDDESGELAAIFGKPSGAWIDLFEACGIADIKGSYGVVLYLKKEECEKAMAVLK